MSRATFSMAGTSTITLSMPLYNSGEDNSIEKDIVLFDFWTGEFDTDDKGITGRPLSLSGIECIKKTNGKLCVPYCVPYCFNNSVIDTTFDTINTMMNDGEELTITGLGSCQNGVYIIKGFSWEVIHKTNCCFRWSLQLELIREP